MTETRKRGTSTPKGKRQLNTYITPVGDAILKAVLIRDGVPFSAQVERALLLWAEHKGIEVPDHGKPERGAGR